MFFTPDPELGTAFGFCVSGAGFSNEGGGLVVFGASSPGSIDESSVFDGEEVIAQFEFPGSLDPASFTFIAEPGQTITRIGFFNVLANDFQVGFCEPEPPVVEEISNQDCFEAIAVEVGALADAATDSEDAYALNLACAALHFAAKDTLLMPSAT